MKILRKLEIKMIEFLSEKALTDHFINLNVYISNFISSTIIVLNDEFPDIQISKEDLKINIIKHHNGLFDGFNCRINLETSTKRLIEKKYPEKML